MLRDTVRSVSAPGCNSAILVLPEVMSRYSLRLRPEMVAPCYLLRFGRNSASLAMGWIRENPHNSRQARTKIVIARDYNPIIPEGFAFHKFVLRKYLRSTDMDRCPLVAAICSSPRPRSAASVMKELRRLCPA